MDDLRALWWEKLWFRALFGAVIVASCIGFAFVIKNEFIVVPAAYSCVLLLRKPLVPRDVRYGVDGAFEKTYPRSKPDLAVVLNRWTIPRLLVLVTFCEAVAGGIVLFAKLPWPIIVAVFLVWLRSDIVKAVRAVGRRLRRPATSPSRCPSEHSR
jgi:hypothetical protein